MISLPDTIDSVLAVVPAERGNLRAELLAAKHSALITAPERMHVGWQKTALILGRRLPRVTPMPEWAENAAIAFMNAGGAA